MVAASIRCNLRRVVPLADTSQNSIRGGGPRDAGEVDFQELGIGGTKGGAVQDAVDVVKALHLVGGTVGGVSSEGLQAMPEFGVKVDAAGLVEVLVGGVEVEGECVSSAKHPSVRQKIHIHRDIDGEDMVETFLRLSGNKQR